jgi:hypothetical protein
MTSPTAEPATSASSTLYSTAVIPFIDPRKTVPLG